VVHRFLVKGTIEERMQVVLNNHQSCSKLDEDPVTLKDLYDMMTQK